MGSRSATRYSPRSRRCNSGAMRGRCGRCRLLHSQWRTPMAQIDRAFVGVALVWLILGMALGLYMGIAADNQLLTVHITMLLSGFVVLAIYGFIYRLWPALKESPLAKAQLWIAIVAVLGQVVGAYQFATSGGTEITIIALASVLALLSGLLLGWLFLTKSAETQRLSEVRA